MDITAVASIICLSIAGPLCICGIFCNAYRENWAQFVGLWGMGAWCFSRIEVIADRGYTEPWDLVLHFGLAMFSLGVAIKVVKHSRQCQNNDDLPEVGRDLWHNIRGGMKE